MKEIKKKIEPKYFKEVAEGKKDFEIRKDDSDYEVGDILILQEYQPLVINIPEKTVYEPYYTGNEITKRIKYKITHEEFPQGIQEGYCVLGLEDIEKEMKLISTLAYIKKQYETDFTKEELGSLEPRDECIYGAVIESLKENM